MRFDLGKIKIANIDAGRRKIVHIIQQSGANVLEVIPINEGRYYLIKTDQINYLFAYKREFFFTFGTRFKDLGETGVGDSFNRQDIKNACAHDVRMIFSVYENGHVYSISMQNFLQSSHLWQNSEGKEILSTSIKNLTRID